MEDLAGSSNRDVAEAAQAASSALRDVSGLADADQKMPVQRLFEGLVHSRDTLPESDPTVAKLNTAIVPVAKLVRLSFYGHHNACICT